MNVIQCTPSLALKNLGLLLQILINSCPKHEYRNAIIYGGNSSRDIVSDIINTSLGSSLPWMYLNMDQSVENIRLTGTVRSSTLNLVFLQNLKEIYLARRIKRKASHTIFISLADIPQNLSEIEETMKMLKIYRVSNAVLVFWKSSIEIWTSNNFHNMYSILVFSSSSSNFSAPSNFHERIFFPKTRNLHGKTLGVFGYEKRPKMIKIPKYLQNVYPGVEFGGRDGFLADSIARKLNVKLDYSISEIHNVSENTSNAYQIVDSLNNNVFQLHKRPDLILISSHAELHSTDYELLQPHEVDCVSIVIPSIGKPLLIGIGEVLSIPIVKFSPIILLLIVLAWCVILSVNEPKRLDGARVILDTLGIFLRTKCDCYVKTLSEKILLMALFIFTTIMGGLFTEFVYHNLVKPPFVTDIDTLSELIDSGITIWAENYVIKFLKDIENTTNGRLLNQIVETERPVIISAMLAKNMSQGYALLHSTIEMHLKNKEMWEDGVNIFHEISECLIPIHIAFKIVKHSPLKETINDILFRFMQMGYFPAFRRMEVDLLHRMNISNVIPETSNEYVAYTLDMNYFVDIFIFLICGLFISFMAFLGEIAFDSYQSNKSRRIRWIKRRK